MVELIWIWDVSNHWTGTGLEQDWNSGMDCGLWTTEFVYQRTVYKTPGHAWLARLSILLCLTSSTSQASHLYSSPYAIYVYVMMALALCMHNSSDTLDEPMTFVDQYRVPLFGSKLAISVLPYSLCGMVCKLGQQGGSGFSKHNKTQNCLGGLLARLMQVLASFPGPIRKWL